MDEEEGAAERLVHLCNKLGKLMYENDMNILDEELSEEKIMECQVSLVGQLFQNPSVNFQALQTAMKKAWRNEYVEVKPLENGKFSFAFCNEGEKNQVLEGGPWSFSNHLLLLKPWEPDTPLHCYEFKTCAFWVRIFGLPLEWNFEGMVKKIASSMGKVQEVKIDARGPAAQRIGKARVEMDMNTELRVGQLMRHQNRKVWLDFKYERLPFFCYSCGKIGHYANYCKDIPYDEEKFTIELGGCFGSWLKAETPGHSPFWKVFYKKESMVEEIEESIPETPEHQRQNAVMEDVQPISPSINSNIQ
ncbi:uncharacterized protein LOC115664653 [Syzygium oleosum]|uniref:uncharacterized protein LOC115664653 n=1 Tax=Syzygium oleosum TaxID=219896 RepID=UPI0024BB621F|nr:uncharacterized protein LOC115664653 [Syzygium oleosum]